MSNTVYLKFVSFVVIVNHLHALTKLVSSPWNPWMFDHGETISSANGFSREINLCLQSTRRTFTKTTRLLLVSVQFKCCQNFTVKSMPRKIQMKRGKKKVLSYTLIIQARVSNSWGTRVSSTGYNKNSNECSFKERFQYMTDKDMPYL